MKIRAVIIEDEKHAVTSLQKAIDEIANDIEVIAILSTVEDSVNWLLQNETDLIFLDIHLGDNISFKIFEQVKTNAGIIFITAYNEYVLRAFKLNSVDYLLKPLQDEDLKFAIDKFRANRQNSKTIDIESLLLTLNNKPSYSERFMVVTGQKIKSIQTDEIAYFLSEGRYAKIVTKNNERYLYDQSLESIENSVNPSHFFRINRQFIVSIHSIHQMYVWTKSRVKLEIYPDPEREVIVSIDKSGEFKKWLDR